MMSGNQNNLHMESMENLTLAKIISLRPEAAPLFEKYQLDFCCGGKQTLAEALRGNSETLELIKNELYKISKETDSKPTINFQQLSLDELIDYIIRVHHRYVKESLPVMQEHIQKIAFKHGAKHSELKSIASLFTELKKELEQHLLKEEVILFPAIRQLEAVFEKRMSRAEMILLETPIQVMETEHEIAGNAMRELRKLSNNFTAPDDGCTTYRLAFDELKKFELDLHQHVHLENNILYPKALELQKKLIRVS